MQILFDPNLYLLSDEQLGSDEAVLELLNYLVSVLQLLKNHPVDGLPRKVSVTENELQEIYELSSHSWTDYKECHQFTTNISIIYYDLFSLFDICDIRSNNTTYFDTLSPQLFHNTEKIACYYALMNHLSEIENSSDSVFFLGTCNLNYGDILRLPNSNKEFSTIGSILDIEVTSFSNGFRKFLLDCKMTQPTIANPLPANKICKEYNSIKDNYIQNGEDQTETYIKIVNEVALRNGYIKDSRLSRINSTPDRIRKIYTFHNIVYLSTDVRHGTIEVFNYHGKHQGEYFYNGEMKPNSKDTSGSHDIRVS